MAIVVLRYTVLSHCPAAAAGDGDAVAECLVASVHAWLVVVRLLLHPTPYCHDGAVC